MKYSLLLPLAQYKLFENSFHHSFELARQNTTQCLCKFLTLFCKPQSDISFHSQNWALFEIMQEGLKTMGSRFA